jgi:hypothetical protein
MRPNKIHAMVGRAKKALLMPLTTKAAAKTPRTSGATSVLRRVKIVRAKRANSVR